MTKKIAIIGCPGMSIGRSILRHITTKMGLDVVLIDTNDLKWKDFVEINEEDRGINILKTAKEKEIPTADIQKSGKQSRRERRKQLKKKRK